MLLGLELACADPGLGFAGLGLALPDLGLGVTRGLVDQALGVLENPLGSRFGVAERRAVVSFWAKYPTNRPRSAASGRIQTNAFIDDSTLRDAPGRGMCTLASERQIAAKTGKL